ncbi:hypothetical protein COCOR_02924 [Corallococcus coralloides DSM 2259]|uniref:Lipoprotein n=1 Tax=Corallococcus coralloides (strain ATCC 25202 / DSM 2259 / NBRC 100086 / M2) TaxID=1144275 RepID=H8MYR5_CORCM|nr:hypothetical protein COCOR_02924 [Corallococcus coralloides DSM 2259]
MSRWTPFLFLLTAGLMACGSPAESPEVPAVPSERTHIRAAYDDGQPVVNASVRLNGVEAGWTDSAGELTLELSQGQHQFELQLGTGDDTFSRFEQTLEKGTEPQEVSVRLPRPVRMLAPSEVTTSSVHLVWEQSDDRKFREYKVYASHSPAFDETNGVLVHVGTEVSQTDAQLMGRYVGGGLLLSADTHLYFRVFVLGENGTLAGSNVLHVQTPKWANAANFTRSYRLTLERNFAGAWPIFGVAYDGSALWFLYRQDVGGYYDPDTLTLVQRDPVTLAVLNTFVFEDYRVPTGMTWDGSSLWVSLGGSNNRQLISINPVTGAHEQAFVTTEGTESLAWTGSLLLQSKGYIQGPIERVDLATGGIAGTFINPFTQRGAHRAAGIAYRPGEIWGSDLTHSDLVILDDAGVHIGVVASASIYRHMTFMGDRLVGITGDSLVHVLKVDPQ